MPGSLLSAQSRPSVLKRSDANPLVNEWTQAPYDYMDVQLAAIGLNPDTINRMGDADGMTVDPVSGLPVIATGPRNLLQSDSAITSLHTYMQTVQAENQALQAQLTALVASSQLPPVTVQDANKFLRSSGDASGFYWGSIDDARTKPFSYPVKPDKLVVTHTPGSTANLRTKQTLVYQLSEAGLEKADFKYIYALSPQRPDSRYYADMSTLVLAGPELSVEVDMRAFSDTFGPWEIHFVVDGRGYDVPTATYEAASAYDPVTKLPTTYCQLAETINTSATPDAVYAPVVSLVAASGSNQVMSGVHTFVGKLPQLGVDNGRMGIQLLLPPALAANGRPSAHIGAWLTNFSQASAVTANGALDEYTAGQFGVPIFSSTTDEIEGNILWFDLDLRRFPTAANQTFRVTVVNANGTGQAAILSTTLAFVASP